MIDFLSHIFEINLMFPKELIVAVAWGLWRRRCDLIHAQTKPRKDLKPISLHHVNGALLMVEEFKKMKLSLINLKKEENLNELKKVLRSMDEGLLVFIDASFREDSGENNCGIVIVDDHGNIKDQVALTLGKMDTPFEAELMAINEGLIASRK